jgi:4-amino-4-deoxy-L-arabinose transferase-like glycosyltransferase
LTYHLYFPAVWIQTGQVFLVDGVYPYNYLAYYPKNHELINTFLMVIVRNDVFVKLYNIPLAILSAVAAGLLCVRLGGSKRAGWCAGIFVLTIPAMFSWVATTYVEPLLNCGLVAAVYFVVCAYKAEAKEFWRCGLLAGLALGLAAGTKYTALYLVVLLFPIVVAVPLVRQLSKKTAVYFPALFAAGFLLTGIWWYAINGAVTGNPVYPVPFGPLNAIHDPLRPTIHESSILTRISDLVADGTLMSVLYGQRMGLGPKLLALLPLFVGGLAFALNRRRACGLRHDWAGAAAMVTVATSALIMLYTYLRVPFWDDIGSLYCQVRFGIPFVMLAVVMGFAALDQTRLAPWLPLLTGAGLLIDAWVLDLRLPNLAPLPGLLVLCALGACAYLLRNVRWNPRVACRLGAVAVIALLFPLLASRENNRYRQWASPEYFEVHGGYHPIFAPVAHLLDEQFRGAPLAYAGDFASYLYMFVGARFEHPIRYVSTWSGPALSYEKQGTLRDQLDREAWEKNLQASGAQLLISFRFQDRQLEASNYWPAEWHWAEDLDFPVVFKNDYCYIHQVNFPTGNGPAQQAEVSQDR